ncbi:permease YjgP/YjgQ [Marinomonas sp. MED121]|uniref:LPS export ABC transporter permease LptG n=1 Tax=Marinomonas sp. MED121 TaxID=314277 RepID=UPI0000690F18|nr:LPS export ABC transporter permease LptG [Marinomonas sp. MED121]EAQ64220.1 permease YjgP/YjgQ [Marinomonas sp. MED121]
MKQLDSYIGKGVVWAFFAVVFILLGLDYVLTFIEQVKRISEFYTISNLLEVLLLRLPSKFAEYIPIASLIGTLVGLGALASTSELTVIRAAGIPIWRIGWSAIKPILIISLIGVGISEFIAPNADQRANLIENLKKQQTSDNIISGGVWIRSEEKYIFIGAADQKGTLYNVKVFNSKNQTLQSTQIAKTAQYKTADEWTLNQVTNTQFLADKIESNNTNFESLTMTFKPEHLYLATQEPEALSLSQSISYQNYLEGQDLNTSRYELEFWTKALRPVASIALVLIALSSVFGPLRSSTMGSRIFSGVMIGIIFQNGLNLFGRMSLAADFSPLLGVLIPIAICLAIGTLQLKRAK